MTRLLSDNEVHDRLHRQARELEALAATSVAGTTAVDAAVKLLDLLALGLVAAGVARDRTPGEAGQDRAR